MSSPRLASSRSLSAFYGSPQVKRSLLFFHSLPSYRMLINSTRAICLSSLPWRLSTPRLRLATTGEARAPKGTPQTPEGLKPLPRKSCSHAGKKRQTTAPSLPCSDLLMAPATQSREAPTMGQGQRPQSNLFCWYLSFRMIWYHIRWSQQRCNSNLSVQMLTRSLQSWREKLHKGNWNSFIYVTQLELISRYV